VTFRGRSTTLRRCDARNPGDETRNIGAGQQRAGGTRKRDEPTRAVTHARYANGETFKFFRNTLGRREVAGFYDSERRARFRARRKSNTVAVARRRNCAIRCGRTDEDVCDPRERSRRGLYGGRTGDHARVTANVVNNDWIKDCSGGAVALAHAEA